uniref:Calcium/calmodulin-dependent protein kinase type 1D-like n=1 Tax=Dermatophagoides pteronyssinus TaxID=6956 RepID=A0A6P6YA00_DERPT|nr:calcium/calmodulin-dependent protein kinase type 1D-like [Dermatophagoides pteronyssinus]
MNKAIRIHELFRYLKNYLKLFLFSVQLLKTLEYLHRCGIIHRDIKPENLLLTSENLAVSNIKIADFGLSCLCSHTTKLTQACGTLVYAAPEIISNQGYDHKVDIWSVGVILYLMISSKFPFPMCQNSLNEPIDKLKNIFKLKFEEPEWNNISGSCKDFISKLLQFDANARFSSEEALKHVWIKHPCAVSTN